VGPLGIFVRRSTGVRAFVVLVAAGLAAVFSRTTWQGEWARSFDWAMGAVILVGPVAAGIAAYDAQAYFGRRWRTISGNLARTGRDLPLVVGATWWWASLAWVLCALVALGVAATTSSGPPRIEAWACLEVFAILFATSALGAVVGLVVPHLVAAPLAVVVAFCGPILASWLGTDEPFVYGGATATLVGLRYDKGVAVTLLCLDLLVGALLVCAAVVRVRGVRLAPIATMGAVGSFGVLIVIGVAAPSTANRYEPNPNVRFVCIDASPQICMAEATSRDMRAFDATARPMFRALVAAHATVPARYQQVVGGAGNPAAGSIMLSDDDLTRGEVSATDVALSVARPADCPAYYAEAAPHQALDAQAVIADWLLRRSGTGSARGWAGATIDDEIQAGGLDTWVRRTFEQLSHCELSSVAPPA